MHNIGFAPDAEDTSLLAQYPVGTPLKTEVRIVFKTYRNDENGYSVYDVEDNNYRRLKINGYFPTPLRLDGYYMVDGVVK